MQNIIKILFWVTGTLVLTFLCKNVQYFLKKRCKRKTWKEFFLNVKKRFTSMVWNVDRSVSMR